MRNKLFVVIFLFLCQILAAQDDIKVLSSNSSTMVVEYTPTYLDTIQINSNNELFTRIILKSSATEKRNVGLPELPFRSITIGVPSELNNSIQILKSEFTTINGNLSPVPEINSKNGIPYPTYKINDNYGSSVNVDLVNFGDYGITRGIAAQNIKIYPIQFDAASRQIKLYSKIVFQINLVNNGKSKFTVKDNLLDKTLLNYSVAKNWGIRSNTLKKVDIEPTVLSSGTWYRFNVTEEGIYKIDRAKLSTYGIDAASVDPRTIKIYNNGGELLPEKPSDDRPYDLVENAIMVSGESDGSFDNSDYILFYARGINYWSYNKDNNKIERNTHWYSKENYYWITSGGARGKRMESVTSQELSNSIQQTSTKTFISFEEDKINLLQSGRISVGDEFTTSTQSRTYANTLNNRINGSEINYTWQFVNFSASSAKAYIPLTVYENGTSIFYKSLGGAQSDYVKGRLHFGSATYNGSLTDYHSMLKFQFQTSSAEIMGYLDYYTIEYLAWLKAVDNKLTFFSLDTTANVEYHLSGFTNSLNEIFDVSDYNNVKYIKPSSQSGSELRFFSEETSGNVSKYFAVNSSAFLTPEDGTAVQNSSIKNNLSGVEYIIITTSDFWSEAERLANYRQNSAPDKVSSAIYNLKEIYNEFSCGMQDPVAIRDFIKFAYDNWNTKPVYVCFLGDGDFDYFNLEGKEVNFIPTFQTVDSFDGLNSYPYDDFYARVDGNDDRVDIALGRLPVRSLEDAKNVIDKIIYYETESKRGLWRNTITFVADDGLTSEGDDGFLHTNQSEILSESDGKYVPKYFNRNKIYLAAYPQVITGAGRRKPAVNEAIINSVNSGTLILNYIGHGNPEVWAHEYVFERSVSIPLFNNQEYFFLSAATCDYGRFDDPYEQSATEEMLMLENKGMIGGYSASRAVYSHQNAALNQTFFTNLFNRDDDSKPVPVGIAYFKTKAEKTGDNDEKYHLFCDPALRLAEPNRFATIDSLNGQVPKINLQISALSNSSIKGRVLDENGQFDSEFNGEAIVSVFDSQKEKELEEINNYVMTEPGGVIFRGRVSITNGTFEADFTVPKDISYENDRGKIVAYVFDDDVDGVGYTSDFVVGGTNNNNQNDGAGPEIEIYYDDISFENSYLVNPNFTLLIKLNDETGLNTTGNGVGHKLEGILNGDETNAIDFSNFFIGDLNSGGKSGTIDYKFSNLEPGDYKLKIKAWDVYNNLTTRESQFTVVSQDELSIQNVVNYPNPFKGNTTFTFQHNLTDAINVKVKVYTIAGRLVREIENEGIIEKFVKIPWDGRDENGDQIANGTYLYKVIVTSANGGFSENILGKLAVIR